jgi:hypothetical protein
MKKHKANELLHQASMLATTISAQAMTNDGKLPSTITSFGNSSYGNFSTSVTNALDGKGFSITIENVDSGACTQLEKMAGGMVRDVVCSEPDADNKVTATLSYYKNLATNDIEGANSPTGNGDDSGIFIPENAGTKMTDCSDGTPCPAGEECEGFYCRMACPEGTYRMHDGDDTQTSDHIYCITDTCSAIEGECPDGCYFDGYGDQCVKLANICTDGTWNEHGDAYCVNGQWTYSGDYLIPKENSPFPIQNENVKCEMFGKCHCVDSTKTFPNCSECGYDSLVDCSTATFECIVYEYGGVDCFCFDENKEYPNCGGNVHS